MRLKLVAALFIGLLLTGCSSEEDKVRGEFLAGCVQGGSSKKMCRCMFDKMTDSLTDQEMVQMNRGGALTPQILDKTIRAGMACRNK